MDSAELAALAAELYDTYGQRKPMGGSAPSAELPHYFLHRSFLGEQDLLVILNTKRCRYQCAFCQLPAKSSMKWIPSDKILAQFASVLRELKHSLSVIQRVTLSNEGSVLDADTFPAEALDGILNSINALKVVRTVVLESRMEFLQQPRLDAVQRTLRRARINILTGFETLDERIRDDVLRKREPLAVFEQGLAVLAATTRSLTSYVLFKPAPEMTDQEAMDEANRTIQYLVEKCAAHGIDLSIRLNPMYMAAGSRWAGNAARTAAYMPPRLTDVMTLAEKWRQRGLKVYIGLSTEGLDDHAGTYMAREDYRPEMIRAIKLFNDQRITTFGLSR